jgi:hypothetical protein
MIAFVIAVMMDPDVTLPEELSGLFASERPPEEALLAELEAEPAQPVAVANDAPVRASVPISAEPAAVPKPARPRRNELQVRVGAAWGNLPGVAAGAELAYARRLRSIVLLRGSARAFPALREDQVERQRTIEVQSYDATLQACVAHDQARRLGFGLCTGPELDVWLARGRGFDAPTQATLFGAGFSLAPELRIRLKGGFGMHFSALLRVNLLRPRFQYTSAQGNESTAFYLPRASAGLALGPSYAF